MCDQCEQSLLYQKGLNIHVEQTHMENIPQLDEISVEIVADEAVKICNLTKHEDDLTT